MRLTSYLILALAFQASACFGQATHNIFDGFSFGDAPANPFMGWTFADGSGNALTTYTSDWNAPDFAPGQPGWEGPPGAPHAGWAMLTEDNALLSGLDVVAGEVVTHGSTNVIYTPSAAQGDPFTGQHSVSISGSLHNVRGLGRSGPWFLMRNNTDILASGIVNDFSLSIEQGPFDLATSASFIDSSQVTVTGNQLTGISYNPGDYFNLTMGNNDFVAVNFSLQSSASPGNGFGQQTGERTPVAYYRFEETSGVDIKDSLSGLTQGAFVGVPAGAERSTDVPTGTIPQTGMANLRAADLRQGGSVLLTGSRFVFNGPNAGGATGDATLEWYMKVPSDDDPSLSGPNGHTSIFWTQGLGGLDAERYNIFWDANFTGAPDSDRFISGDFRSLTNGGGATPIDGSGYNNGNPLTENEWHHIAIVRTDNTPGDDADFDFTWNWYIDGELSPTHTATTDVGTPTQDAFGWTIGGRPGFDFHALIDEVRLTASALSPSQFLNAAGSTNGDFNNDQRVDGTDFLLWQQGQSPHPLSAEDLAAWKSSYGQQAASGASAAVPEPSALGLAAVCVGLGLADRRKRIRVGNNAAINA